jgi:aldehyde dehydrogenase (NAD+)
MRIGPHVPGTDIEEIPDSVRGLRLAFESGATRPLEARRGQLERLQRMLREHIDEWLDALHADLAKPALEAWAGDLGPTLLECRTALRKLERWAGPESVGLLPLFGRARIIREPLGVVLIVAPWNYPLSLLLSPLVGALAAGNTALLKPSELAPHTSACIARRVREYFDSSAVSVVEGGVAETTALLEQRFDHIFYTGNAAVGRIVMQAAARHLTPVTLELGGKSPCIVDQDVDVEVVARRIAWGKFANAGQTCIAPDYVLVHERCESALIAALRRAIECFYGEHPEASESYARIVDERHCERLRALLDGAEIIVGGEVDVGRRYVAPTLVRNTSRDSPLMVEEIFGPILPLLRIESIAHGIDIVTERPRPLALYLFSKDEEVQQQVIECTQSGGVCVNGTLLHAVAPGLPFGGVGESGMGSYHGRHSFETFSHRKPVLTQSLRVDPRFLYPPYGSRALHWLRRLL